MDLTVRTAQIMRIRVDGDPTLSVELVPLSAEGRAPLMGAIRLTSHDWAAMGYPEEVTISVEPGDKIN
jgi:hypothetical protein